MGSNVAGLYWGEKVDFFQNIIFSFPLKKHSHTALELHNGE